MPPEQIVLKVKINLKKTNTLLRVVKNQDHRNIATLTLEHRSYNKESIFESLLAHTQSKSTRINCVKCPPKQNSAFLLLELSNSEEA